MSVAGLSTLLLRWQEARDEGRAVLAAELCADRPELAGALGERIRALESMEHRLGVGRTPAPLSAVPGYDLLELIDHGGMGVVYKARQRGLNRLVALKTVRIGEHVGTAQRARFRAEVEAVARLQHPNIVQIFEVGESEGRPFFSMELVEGGSLARRLADGPLAPREAASLVETLARATHYAHERGVIHRDLKPANVLLAFSRDPEGSA